jgi:lipoprotein-anchoring transpeptidase ErfK/SrfK
MTLPWWGRIQRRTIVVVLVVVAVLAAGSTAAFGYDHSTFDVLLPGTSVGGVVVGGLDESDAVDRVRERIEDPLHLPIRIVAPGFDRMTTPWALGMRVQVNRAVRDALERGRDGNLLRRLWRRLREGGRSFELGPHLDRGRLQAFLKEAAGRVFVAAEDGRMDASDGWIHIRPSRVGRELDLDQAEKDLLRAMRTRAEEIHLAIRDVQPKVAASAFAKVVLIRLGENRLYLYDNGVVTRTYPVASGSSEFPTPTGTFHIVSKRVNPKWVNPGSDWAKRMPSFIPPGPDNPLGSRAMDLNVSGIRIHGTPDAASIGYSVSHGCVRMNMSDAEDLFARVSTGTPVVIFRAGPPKPRPAKTPAPSSPPSSPLVQPPGR